MAKRITILGGGTGSYVVLSALKKYGLDLAAVVTMMDSGGSTGKLRDQLGVLPPGDLRQCLVALSEATELWRKLFVYRFEKGDFQGHSFGNIMISALEKVSSNYNEALDELHYLMHCVGRVYPAALTNADIRVVYSTGRVVDSERLLDESNPDNGRIISAEAIPPVEANPDVIARLLKSDYIITGPGDLYSSIISIALVDGVREAVSSSPATFIYVMNLMTKASQTKDYTASDHIRDLSQYFGRRPDICIVNTAAIDDAMRASYAAQGETPVEDDLVKSGYTGQVIQDDLLDNTLYQKTPLESLGAPFAHSIVRHDTEKLEACLKRVFDLPL